MTEQIRRIMRMEQALDEAAAALNTPEDCRRVQKQLQELEAYYTSPQWRQDYDDDCAGKLPADLKRGVLSQDAVYDLLERYDHLKALLTKDLSAPEQTDGPSPSSPA